MKTAAIILTAGLGTRFLPASKSINKCMMPILNKPVVQYIVEECLLAEIEEIIIVVPEGDTQIRSHFAPDDRLRAHLKRVGKEDFYEHNVHDIAQHFGKLHFAEQKPGDYGNAVSVKAGIEALSDSATHMLVLNGDSIIANGPEIIGEVKSMMQEAAKNPTDGLLIGAEVAMKDRSNYGIFVQPDDSNVISEIAEKPSDDMHPGCSTAVLGWYFMPREFAQYVTDVPINPDNNEYQLTDALNNAFSTITTRSYDAKGTFLDCGRPDTWLATNNFVHDLLTKRD